MSLSPGDRLGSAYEVVGPGWTVGRYEYVRARKLFQNFRYPAESLDDAPADEALDVLIRVPTCEAPELSSPEALLALPPRAGFLEPLDRIDPPEGEGRGPWLVVADPHASRLTDRAEPDPAHLIFLIRDVLNMVGALHESGLSIGPIGPDDFLLDGSGRWYFLGTDRVGPLTEARDDLKGWARFADALLGGGADPGATNWPTPGPRPGDLDDLARGLFAQVRLCLTAPPATVAELLRGRRGTANALRRWLGRRS